MRISLNLPAIPGPQFSESLLKGALKTLQEISQRNLARFENGTETRQFKNRKEELIRQLQRRRTTGETFDQATDVLGRERLLIGIYQEYFGRADAKGWLPAFDNRIARSLLGDRGAEWHSGRRRQITLLFFTCFDELEALQFLCRRLREAYSSTESGQLGDAGLWHEHREALFDTEGPENIATRVRIGETLPQLMERFALPKVGRFSERLRQVHLLRAVQVARLGTHNAAFSEIATAKRERVFGNQLMGAAALKIMVQRVVTEGGRRWPGDWSSWITRFGCDPRYGRASMEGAQWWGWATETELRLAQQGVTGLTLKFFIEFLQGSLRGTDKETQFSLRSRFLLALFEARKIDDARLVLNPLAHGQLPTQNRDPWSVALLHSTSTQTSMVCLKCTDDVYIIEGTHSFGLRLFFRSFPIDGFWDRSRKTYLDRDLRISPVDCPVFLKHSASGIWVQRFFNALRSEFHVEWNDVRVRLP